MENEYFNEEDVRNFYRFFKHKRPTEIRVFDEKKYPNGKSVFVKTEDEFVEKCKYFSVEEKVSVYIGARDRVGKADKDVVSSNFIFFEIDEHKKGDASSTISEREKIKKFLEEKGITITMQGMSGAGYHFYIIHTKQELPNDEKRKEYKDLSLGNFKDVLIEQGFNIDPGVFNLSRVSRVLGTYNYKWNKLSKIDFIDKHVNAVKNTIALQRLVANKVKPTKVKQDFSAEEDSIIKEIKEKWTTGNRQDLAMALAGYLRKVRRLGLSHSESIIRDICRNTNDNEINQRIAAVRASYNKDEDDIKGYTGLQEHGINITEQIIPENKLNFMDWQQLKEYKVPNYNWRIDKILQDKKIIIFAGGSATYKSWLCLNMSICVSLGLNFLDIFKTEQGNVLYIDRENSIPELKNRFNMLLNGMKITNEQKVPVYFLSEQSIKLDNFEDREQLREFIKKNNIKLVIADVYRRLISYEENDAGAVSNFFTNGIKPICEDTGVSFVFIHHHKKGKAEGDTKELLRGSSDLVNFVDGVIQISRDGVNITIQQTKNRSGLELDPFKVVVDTDEEGYFRFAYTGERIKKTTSEKVALDIANMMKEKKIITIGSGQNSILNQFCDEQRISKATKFRAVDILKKYGVLKKNEIVRGNYLVVSKFLDKFLQD